MVQVETVCFPCTYSLRIMPACVRVVCMLLLACLALSQVCGRGVSRRFDSHSDQNDKRRYRARGLAESRQPEGRRHCLAIGFRGSLVSNLFCFFCRFSMKRRRAKRASLRVRSIAPSRPRVISLRSREAYPSFGDRTRSQPRFGTQTRVPKNCKKSVYTLILSLSLPLSPLLSLSLSLFRSLCFTLPFSPSRKSARIFVAEVPSVQHRRHDRRAPIVFIIILMVIR